MVYFSGIIDNVSRRNTWVGLGSTSPNTFDGRIVVPAGGTIKNLYVAVNGGVHSQAVPVSFTVYKGSTATSLTCTVSSGFVNRCSDTVGSHAFGISAGDTLTLRMAATNDVSIGTRINAAVVLGP